MQPQTADQSPASAGYLASYLAFAQFFLLLGWTVYVIYLPALLEQVGISRQYTVWVLLADQLLFAVFDLIAGFTADRAFRTYARIGGWVLAATVISASAFLILPWLPGLVDQPAAWQAPLFLGLTSVWVVSSAALRSPVFGLLSRHAGKASSGLAGIALMGMGFAAAVSPYLGLALKGVDPRLPFALSSLTLVLAAGGLVLAERRNPTKLATQPSGTGQVPEATRPISLAVLLPLILLAALAFQLAVNLNAAPRFLLDFPSNALPWVLPVFWVGFNLSAFSAGRLSRHYGSGWIFAAGCLLGGTGMLIGLAPGGAPAIGGHLLAGLGWGAAMPAAFGLAAESGRPDRVATVTGCLFSVLALATLCRIGANLAGLPQMSLWAGLVAIAPVALWGLAGLAAGLIVSRCYANLPPPR